MPSSRDMPKGALACAYCREKKTRCRGGFPCAKCVALGEECIQIPSKRGKRHVDTNRTAVLEDRLARMETLMHAQAVPVPLSGDSFSDQYAIIPPKSSTGSFLQDVSISRARNEPVGSMDSSRDVLDQLQPPRSTGSTYLEEPYITSQPHADYSLQAGLLEAQEEGKPSCAPSEKEKISISPEKSNWEHLGPTSWITICSPPGLQWVSERSGTQDFSESAKGLTSSWSRRLKFHWNRNRERAPDLDAETAWKYTKAYFEDSFEAIYGVVYRPEFEARLHQHLGDNAIPDDDPSWYALRNIVYATGCRTFLGKQNLVSWVEAQAQSWQYFENALSVHVELLYTPTNLLAVRALAAMNLHLEGAGNPALESMMAASTVRLAQTKGLHRQPARSWNLSEADILHRNWLFWAIYACEKQISHRSGRPSMIEDDDISCQIPERVVPGSTINLETLTHIVTHAQISSRICKTLLSVASFKQTPAALMEKMSELNLQLQRWRESLSPALQSTAPIDLTELRSPSELNSIIYIRFAYYGSLTAIHTIFFYPWISAICGVDPQNAAFSQQIAVSTKIVVDAARNIIQTTRSMRVDATSPQWLVFYYPMVGLINLFLYILKHPSLPTAVSDVAVLDIAVGHFGHLEVVSCSELSYPFTREVAIIAYKTVRNAKIRSVGPSTNPTTPANTNAQLPNMDLNDVGVSQEADNSGADYFDMEMWNIFDSVELTGEGDMIYLPP